MSTPTLDSHDIDHEISFSGFDYPASIEVSPLLRTNTTLTGNASIQMGAMTFRQASLTAIVESTDDKETFQAVYEASAVVEFVDHAGTSYDVVVMTFDASVLDGSAGGGDWNISMTLVEVPS